MHVRKRDLAGRPSGVTDDALAVPFLYLPPQTLGVDRAGPDERLVDLDLLHGGNGVRGEDPIAERPDPGLQVHLNEGDQLTGGAGRPGED